VTCTSWTRACVSASPHALLLSHYVCNSIRMCVCLLCSQGDILAGSVAVALHWALHVAAPPSPLAPEGCPAEAVLCSSAPPAITASLLAAIATKRASHLAFKLKGRSTTSPDVLEELGAALCTLDPHADRS
jgi:hypothetical protein